MKTRNLTTGALRRVVVAVAAMGLAGLASEAATVHITGTVNAVAEITAGTPTTLDNAHLTDGVTDLTITTVNEKSNKKSGYTVTLQSAGAGTSNSAKLTGASTGEVIAYTIKYGGSAVALVNGQAVVTDATDKTGGGGVDKTLSISIPAGFPAADTYNDTLTLTLSNK